MARRADRVVWGEGLLVCPQHFQQHELHIESVIDTRLRGSDPYAWGLTSLEIDPAALAAGEFSIKALTGVLGDGQVVSFPEGDPHLPASRPIAERFPSTASVAEAYIALPVLREGGHNYTDRRDDSANVRYAQYSRQVLDLVDAGSEVEVSFAMPRARVLFGSEVRDDFEVLKVAELRRGAGGGFELIPDFIPTALSIRASHHLTLRTREILGQMLTKRRLILESLRQVDASRVEFTAQDVTRYLQVGAINTHIPLVRHFSESEHETPFRLYQALSQLAGQLTTFSTEIAPETLPPYKHFDLRETFGQLFDALSKLLDLAMQETFIEVPLEARRDGMWIGMLKDPRLADAPIFVLAVDTDAPQQEVSNRVPQLSKIASWKQVPRIVHSAIPGAPLKATHRPPPQIPIRPNVVYFSIDTKHDYWAQILREKTVAVYLPPPFDPSRAKLRLMAVGADMLRAKGAPTSST